MNRKLIPYVNFLLDNNPSPFCDYIICKEILKEDEKTIRDAYEWAKRFKLYTEIQDEQFPDGSWGGFVDAESATNAQKRKYKATARAVVRLRDLALDENDEMTARTANYCRKIIKGEITEIWGRNIENNFVIKNVAHDALFALAPGDPLVSHIKAEQDRTDDGQRSVFRHLLANGPFGLNMTDPYSLNITSDKNAVSESFLHGLDGLKGYALFGEIVSEKIAPFLYSMCERLIDPDDQVPIKAGRYWGTGQYSESWRKYEYKKKDLLLRIIRILNLCD